jgi:hypothetical protein
MENKKYSANDDIYEIDQVPNTGGVTNVVDIKKEHSQNTSDTKLLSREEIMKLSYAVFVSKYKQDGAISKYFYSFDLIRQIIFSIILGSLEGDGFEKAVAITDFNFTHLTASILIRPYSEMKLFIETIITEVIFGICSILVCVVAKEEDLGRKENLGMAILVFNAILLFFIMIIQIKEGILGIVSLVRNFRQGKQTLPAK